MNRILLSIFASALLTFSAFAQSDGKIAGRITAAAGTVLSGTVVRIVQLNRTIVADADGSYEFTNLPPGRYTVTAHVRGFADFARNVVLVRGAAANGIDFQMRLVGVQAQVTVTETGSEQSTLEAIQPTESVNADKILERSNGGFADALIDEPGVNKRSATLASSRPVIRGFDGDRVLVTTDGLRVGSIASQSGNHAEPIDVLSLERIEVVKGPGTILYGSNAIGGVVNAVSRHDEFSHGTSGYFSALGGSNNRQAAVSGGFEQSFGRFMVWGSGTGQRSSDYSAGAGYNKVDNTFTRYASGDGGIGYFGEKAYANFNYNFYKTEYGIPIDPDEPKERSIDFHRNDLRFNGGFRDLDSPISGIQFKFDYSDLNQKEFESEGEMPAEEEEEEPAIVFDNKVYSYRALFNQRRYKKLTGTFGIDGYQRNYRTEGEETLIPGLVRQDSFSAFGLEELNFKRVGFQFGARVENNRYRPQDADLRRRDITGFSGAFGIRVPIYENTVFVANFTRSHRAPAVEELYNNGPHDDTLSFEIGDNNLRPEISNGIDLSLRHQAGRFRAESNFFYYDIKNFVFLRLTDIIDEDTELPLSFYEQGNSRFFGTEESLNIRAYKYLDLFANLDYVNAELKSDSPLPRIPPFRSHLGFDAHYKYLTIRPELTLAAAQKRVFESETPTAGYGVFNIAGNIVVPRKHFANIFSVFAYNLTNKLYYNHISFIKEFAPEIGRGIRFGYTIRFY